MQTYLHDAAVCLEALAVDDGRAGLVVLGLGDPHRLERGHVLGGGATGEQRAQRRFNAKRARAGLSLYWQTPSFIGSLRGLRGESAPHHHPKMHPSQANHAWVSRAPPAACRPEATPPPQRHRRDPYAKTAQRNAQNHLPSTTPREQPVQSGGRRRLPHRDGIGLLLLARGELLLQ